MLKRTHIAGLLQACGLIGGLLGAVGLSQAAPRPQRHAQAAEASVGHRTSKPQRVRPHAGRSKDSPARADRRASSETPAKPAVRLEHLTTHDTLTLRPDGKEARFTGKQMRSVSRVLRCHHTGQRHTISPRLVQVLYSTARHFRSDHIYVVAGYRAPRIARKKGNPKSAHKRGVACDFRLDGVRIEAIRDYLRDTYHNVGVGYYPNSGFIHVDVGRSRPAFWIDYSGPGERARYASRATPSEDSDEREGAVEETAARVPAAQPADDAVIPSDTPAPPALAGAAAGDDASGG